MPPKFDPTVENRITSAIDTINNEQARSARATAAQFDVPYQQVLARMKGRPSLKSNGGLNKSLDEGQELAVIKFLDRSVELGFPVRHDMLHAAANSILRNSGSECTVGKCWAANFVRRHPDYHTVKTKPLAAVRKAAHKISAIQSYFKRFKDIVQEKGIHTADIYNFDETGFRIGCARSSLVITHATKATAYTTDPDNRESITSVECISAGGFAIQPMIIMSGKTHREKSFNNDLHNDILIGLSDTGYSNEILGMQWLQHFNLQTNARRKGAWRLLLFDGHVSHLSYEFVSFCEAHSIIPFCLPPHATHLLQPLDVTVFQPMKHYHGRAIENAVRNGDIEFSKTTFLAAFQTIRDQTFKESTIVSAFRHTGLIPYNPAIVLDKMKALDLAPRTPSPESQYTNSTSFLNTPHGQQITVHRAHIKRNLQATLRKDLPLSPTLATSIHKLFKGLDAERLDGKLAIDELHQRKQDDLAKAARKQGGNRKVQTGGVITVGDARLKIQQREESKLELAEKVLEKALKKERRCWKAIVKDVIRAAKKRLRRLAAIQIAEQKALKEATRLAKQIQQPPVKKRKLSPKKAH